jgi:hypothetical protein
MSNSSLDGKLVWGKSLQEYKHPRTGVRGRFRRYTSRRRRWARRRWALLGDVLRGDPLVPVLLYRIVVIGGPEIGPEPDRLRLGGAALDHDSQRFGWDSERKTGHRRSSHWGNEWGPPLGEHRSCRPRPRRNSQIVSELEECPGMRVSLGLGRGGLRPCPGDTSVWRGSIPPRGAYQTGGGA